MGNIVNKVKLVLRHPSNFFDSIKEEKGIEEAFVYVALLYLFSYLVTFLMFIFFAKQDMVQVFTSLFSNYVITLGLLFVISGLLHLWIKIFRGKGNFQTTYKLYVYSITPSIIFMWLPLVGMANLLLNLILSFAVLVLMIKGTKILHNMSSKKAIFVIGFPFVILFAIKLFVTFSLKTFNP